MTRFGESVGCPFCQDEVNDAGQMALNLVADHAGDPDSLGSVLDAVATADTNQVPSRLAWKVESIEDAAILAVDCNHTTAATVTDALASIGTAADSRSFDEDLNSQGGEGA